MDVTFQEFTGLLLPVKEEMGMDPIDRGGSAITGIITLSEALIGPI